MMYMSIALVEKEEEEKLISKERSYIGLQQVSILVNSLFKSWTIKISHTLLLICRHAYIVGFELSVVMLLCAYPV